MGRRLPRKPHQAVGFFTRFPCTKRQSAIDEPLPDDLHPYLEAFLKTWRPVLLRQARKFGGVPTHRRLWVDIYGKPMEESTLRSLISGYKQKEFGTAVWPHLFRDCMLTSVAIDQPDLVRMSTTLLGHASTRTGEQHYNQARMIDASRRYGATISELRRHSCQRRRVSTIDRTSDRPGGHGCAVNCTLRVLT